MNKDVKLVMEAIISCFGEEYEEYIVNDFRKIKLNICEDNEYSLINDEKIYVGKEPVCVKKDDYTYLLMPRSVLNDKYGNVMIVHAFIHALGRESLIVDDNELLNEVVVDYFANEVCKKLDKLGVNLVDVLNPSYTSNSSYSTYFNVVKDFCENNKNDIVKSRLIEGYDMECDSLVEMLNMLKNSENKMSVKTSLR